MSEKAKKRKNEDEDKNEKIEKSESDSEEDEESGEESIKGDIENVQAEFEAFSPSLVDLEGVKALLKQLFKKEPIELGMLADHLIKETNLCTVIKQLINEKVDEEDEDVFSLTSFIQLDKLAGKPFIKLIKNYLIRTAKEKGCEKFVQILKDPDQRKVLVLNERFINLPAKIGVMSLEGLIDETDKQNLQINYYLFICKLLKAKNKLLSKKENHKRSKSNDENGVIYLNAEDEIFSDNALEKYEFKITDTDSDLTVQKNWKSGQQFTPYRRVLLLDRNGLNNSLKKCKDDHVT